MEVWESAVDRLNRELGEVPVRPPASSGKEHQENDQTEEAEPQDTPEPAVGFHEYLKNT